MCQGCQGTNGSEKKVYCESPSISQYFNEDLATKCFGEILVDNFENEI